MKRRLSAIMAADVVGYSRLMGVSEIDTLTSLKSHRSELIDPFIADHQGRIVKLTGDGMLVEFPSVVGAVECAVAVQRTMRHRNTDIPDDQRIQFRIGINLGDVIVEDDDIFGDGVNVAARIESIAAPGGVAVSGSVRENIGNKLDFVFEDMGEQELKNIAFPVRVYNVAFDSENWPSKPAAMFGKAIEPKARPLIAVLPFNNMSGEPDQEYFGDGISEDITTDLSKISALSVISRNTAFTFKGHSVDVREIVRKLGVTHVLEGSVRKSGNRVRITAQFIDGKTGQHIWAERFDRDLTDIFAIQDEISKAIVSALKVKLLPAEKTEIQNRGTSNADAYNLYLMARNYWVSGNYGDIDREQRVKRLTQRAVEIDPDYAEAWALMALAQASLRYYFGIDDEDAESSAERALSSNPTVAEAYAVKSRILSERGDFDAANREIQNALELGPDSWEVNREAARLASAQRRLADAAQHYEKAVSLIDTDFHSWAMLVTCYKSLGDRQGVLRGAEMMRVQAEKALVEDPSNGAALGIAAGGYAIAGNRDRAMEMIERALLIDPDNLNMRYNFGCILTAYLQERNAALDLIEPVLARASLTLVKAASVDPDLEILKGEPRFERALSEAQKRLGITPIHGISAAT